MKRIPFLLAASAAVLLPVAGASARPHEREQDEAFRGKQQGRFMSLRDLENRIVPQMRGFAYLGPELDPDAGRYRLKFMRGPQVVWIDIDARTGAILGRSGF